MKTFRKNSSSLIEGIERTPSRSMLRAVGFKNADFAKPLVGIASSTSNLTPCNMHLSDLAKYATSGVCTSGGKAINFSTITVSDGISMGTHGMRYSLVSREIIADSIETVAYSEGIDGLVVIGGCDKNIPGAMIAIARLNRPAILIYGGTILPGFFLKDKEKRKPLDIISIFEAVGKYSRGEINEEVLKKIEKCAIPGPGSCGSMYTANTMASAIEVMGMSLPNSSAQFAIGNKKRKSCYQSGKLVINMLKRGITPRDIMTSKAFKNAISVCIALGGSTNIVLHLLSIAYASRVQLSIDDFQEIGELIPVICDVKPFGRYNMDQLIRIGGIRPLTKLLLEKGILHGDCMTVEGITLAETLSNVDPYYNNLNFKNQVLPWKEAIKSESHIRIIRGNIAPEGSVGKITGKEGLYFKGVAKVYESEEEATKNILSGNVVTGDVIVIRNEGPVGGPGMREMLSPTSTVAGRGLIKKVALITDGRFSGGTHGFNVGHITPESACGGPIGIVKNGDYIEIDAGKNTITLLISDKEYKQRMLLLQPIVASNNRGVLVKYSSIVSTASDGAVTY